MNLLDQIIASHGEGGGAAVVREAHDVGAINWVNGVTDPGEMIRCGYLPEARRQEGETDSAYVQRIRSIIDALPANERAKIMSRGRDAAIRRAGLDMSNGRVNMFAAGKLPWHELGVLFDKALTDSRQAMIAAGQDFSVDKVAHQYPWNGETRTSTESFALVRRDTGEEFASVGSRFKPIQNVDAWGFMDKLLESYGAYYETAGSLFGGRKVWILAHMPKQAFRVNGDEIKPYLCMMNPHDGSGCGYVYPTTVRIECNNTLTTSAKDMRAGLKIRHTGNIGDKLRDAGRAVGLSVNSLEHFKESAEFLHSKPCNNIRHYASDVLDACLEVTAAQAMQGADALAAALKVTQAKQDLAAKSFERKIERRGEILDDIIERWDRERCAGGTLWHALNAVTEHADHAPRPRSSPDRNKRLSQRFESTLNGDADTMKQSALQVALAHAAR